MNLGVSQGTVQSDSGQQLHPSRARLPAWPVDAEPWTLVAWAKVAPSRSGRGVGRWPGRGGCGGGGAVLAAFCCVSCSSSTLWSMSLMCRSSIWCLARCCARQGLWSRQCSPWSSAVAVLGQGGDMLVFAQRQVRSLRSMSSTSLSSEILQLQYIDKVIDVCCAGPADSCCL